MSDLVELKESPEIEPRFEVSDSSSRSWSHEGRELFTGWVSKGAALGLDKHPKQHRDRARHADLAFQP